MYSSALPIVWVLPGKSPLKASEKDEEDSATAMAHEAMRQTCKSSERADPSVKYSFIPLPGTIPAIQGSRCGRWQRLKAWDTSVTSEAGRSSESLEPRGSPVTR